MKRFMFVLSVALAVLCFFPAVFAAGADPEMREGGAGYFTTGFTWLDIDELNDTLKASPLGFKTFDAHVISYGGGGYAIIAGRVILGGEGYGFSQEASNASYIQRLSGGWGLFNAGYLVFHKAGFRVFPMVGVRRGDGAQDNPARHPRFRRHHDQRAEGIAPGHRGVHALRSGAPTWASRASIYAFPSAEGGKRPVRAGGVNDRWKCRKSDKAHAPLLNRAHRDGI